MGVRAGRSSAWVSTLPLSLAAVAVLSLVRSPRTALVATAENRLSEAKSAFIPAQHRLSAVGALSWHLLDDEKTRELMKHWVAIAISVHNLAARAIAPPGESHCTDGSSTSSSPKAAKASWPERRVGTPDRV